MEAKLKHLEFLQNVITRMNTNSFLIKGWGITLVAAIIALTTTAGSHRTLFLTGIVIPMFWFLDGFYLSQERQYRSLYKHVAGLSPSVVDFDMNAKRFATAKNCWRASVFSRTLLLFYAVLVVVTSATALTLRYI